LLRRLQCLAATLAALVAALQGIELGHLPITFQFEPAGPLNPLQRTADGSKLLVRIHLQHRAGFEVRFCLVRTTGHLVRQPAEIIDARVLASLRDGGREIPMGGLVVALKECMDASPIHLVENIFLGLDRGRRNAEQADARNG
jgi:hypothetical protein